MTFGKLHPVSLGICAGLLAAIAAFSAGLALWLFYTGKPLAAMMGVVYFTYTPSLLMSMIGAGAAGVGGFVVAFIGAEIYNRVLEYILDDEGEF